MLSTDSFILSLRRFIGRKQKVKMIRSDDGTNFVGISAEPIPTFQEMDHNKFGDFLEKNGGDWMVWKRNPALASNMEGAWEGQVRSSCSILNSLLKTHGSNLTEESLQTLVVEVEAIVNSRPLTTEVINYATSLAPLSPNQPCYNEIKSSDATTWRFHHSRQIFKETVEKSAACD